MMNQKYHSILHWIHHHRIFAFLFICLLSIIVTLLFYSHLDQSQFPQFKQKLWNKVQRKPANYSTKQFKRYNIADLLQISPQEFPDVFNGHTMLSSGSSTFLFNMVSIVNLPYRKERWKFISSHLLNSSTLLESVPIVRHYATVGRDINLVDLYSSNKLSEAAYRSLIYPRTIGGEYMTIGALGCLLSHVALWKKCAESKKVMIVFEDDIEITSNFDQYFGQILSELPSSFGIFYFADMVQTENTIKASTSFSPLLNRLNGEHWGTFAYMITPEVAQILYSTVYPIQYQVDSHMINTAKKYSIEVYRSKINLVTTSNDPNRLSDVQVRYDKNLKIHIPLNFHIFEFVMIPSQVTEFKYRIQYDRNGNLRRRRKVELWSLERLSIEIGSNPLERGSLIATDPLYDILILMYKLKIGYLYGGLFLNPDFITKFPIGKAFRGLHGFIGFEQDPATGKYTFPVLGLKKNEKMILEMIHTIELKILEYKNEKKINPTKFSIEIFNIFQRYGSSSNIPNTILIFPMKLLEQNKLLD